MSVAPDGVALSPHEAAALALLDVAPERWSNLDRDHLTATEVESLIALNHLALIEIRSPVTMHMVGHPVTYQYTLTRHGEVPPDEESQAMANIEYPEWTEAFANWQASDAGHTSPFRMEVSGSEEWRLTAPGADLRTKVAKAKASDRSRMIQFLFQFNSMGRLRPPIVGRCVVSKVARNGPTQPVSTPRHEVNVANWPEGAKEIAKLIGEAMQPLLAGRSAAHTAGSACPQYITLDQMAAWVSKSKDTLERKKNAVNSDMPPPDVEGPNGTAHEWRWDKVRPWLERTFGKTLPEILPPTIR